MQRILVATDFSPRSDRALRRAVLLARRTSASLMLVHVVDDDRPPRLRDAEERAAAALLRDTVRSLREVEGVACSQELLTGDAFAAIVEAAESLRPDLLVLGPHRRQALRDVFVGTTAERTIRQSCVPAVMANGVPSGPYKRLLLATDFSDSSLDAGRTLRALGLADGAEVVVLNVFDAPAKGAMLRASLTEQQVEGYLAEERKSAEASLGSYLARVGLESARAIARPLEISPAHEILAEARREAADLVVVGTRRRRGVGLMLLGSVAEGVLRDAEIDVLAVPPREPG